MQREHKNVIQRKDCLQRNRRGLTTLWKYFRSLSLNQEHPKARHYAGLHYGRFVLRLGTCSSTQQHCTSTITQYNCPVLAVHYNWCNSEAALNNIARTSTRYQLDSTSTLLLAHGEAGQVADILSTVRLGSTHQTVPSSMRLIIIDKSLSFLIHHTPVLIKFRFKFVRCV